MFSLVTAVHTVRARVRLPPHRCTFCLSGTIGPLSSGTLQGVVQIVTTMYLCMASLKWFEGVRLKCMTKGKVATVLLSRSTERPEVSAHPLITTRRGRRADSPGCETQGGGWTSPTAGPTDPVQRWGACRGARGDSLFTYLLFADRLPQND